MPNKPPIKRQDYSLLSKVWNIGSVIICLTLLGHWLDHKSHTFAVFTLTGAALGIMYCFYNAWRALKGK